MSSLFPSWNGKYREFHQYRGKKDSPRLWGIKVTDNVVHTSWGILYGAIQKASETFEGINKGKQNEKTADQYALERAEEAAYQRKRKGYYEVDPETKEPLESNEVSEIDFTKRLPDSLCFWKPDNSIGKTLQQKSQEGKVWYVRKRNGMMFVLVCDCAGEVQIYSRRMLTQHDDEKGSKFTWNERFPHIVEGAKKLMPPRSILLGELVSGRNGKESYELVQRVTKSLTNAALELQSQLGWLEYCVWDVAWWNGQNFISNNTLKARYELIHELDYTANKLFPIEVFEDYFKSTEEALAYAIANGYEGWVVIDPEAVFEDKAYNFKGHPDRPGLYAAKLKPEFEDDFIAIFNPEKEQGEYSQKERYATGEAKGIGSVALFQLDQKHQMVFISNCNSGMSAKMKTELASPKHWPQVWKVAYSGRRYISEGDDTNALDFAKFREVRTDKKTWECINPRL